ncbi:MAG TPA: VWA domain-containing protein [Verrucomicrobiae bacterium]|nr:VWA domain-containing protein [Verrucomicrobiae bacterium]
MAAADRAGIIGGGIGFGEYTLSADTLMDFSNPHFEEPHGLWLAFLGPVLLWLLQRHAARARARQLAKVASPHFIHELTASHSPGRRRLKEVLLLLAVACVGLALARPQWGELELADEWLGEDVVFALDCSNSMLAADIRPNRMQRAKLAIRDFVRQGGSGRVGLVAFAGGAFLQCPLTFDHEAFEDALQAIDERTIPTPGTDIGRALAEADHAMEKKSRRKLIVLVTDGEDLEKGGVQTADTLKTNGVVVFTVGVGSPAGTEIQVVNQAGQLELLRDAKGEVVRSRLDEETLQAIAKTTGGSYYPLGPRGDGLSRVRSAFASLADPLAGNRVRRRGQERFHVPVAVGLVLLTIERLIGTRRRKERVVTMATPSLAIQVCVLGLAGLVLGDSSTAATNEATNAVVAPKPERIPVSPREKYNLGTRKLAEGKYADAESLFQSVLAAQDERTRPAALYNLGHVRVAQGAEELEKGPSGKQTIERNKAAIEQGQAAIQEAQSALAERDLNKMVSAYLSGRGARREFRGALQAVKKAMEAHGATLLKWRRALGDFRSAAELNPSDTNAVQNAKIVEQEIAKLVDSLREMMQTAMMMGEMSQQLKGLMEELRGQIPMENMPPGAPGDDGEEVMPEALRGHQEDQGKEGRELEKPLSQEEAGRLLDGLLRDGGRRLPMSGREMGGDKEGKPSQRPTKPW